MLAQIEPWRLRFNNGGSESTLEAQIEPWSLRLIPGGSDEALKAQNGPWGLTLRSALGARRGVYTVR